MCQEYGPMSMDVLQNAFTVPHHFKTLRITDFLLQKIGIYCTSKSETKEECISMMESIVTSNITCDSLYLPLFVMDWNMGNLPNAQPREVINEILKQWKVKKISLKFVKNPYRNVSRPWRRPGKRFFTPFHFGMTPDQVAICEVSNVLVDLVVVDARWSEMEHRYKEHWEEPYLYLFSNLIRLIPTSEYILVIRELKEDVALMLDDIFSNLVKYAWNQCPENSRTKLFIRLKYSDSLLIGKEKIIFLRYLEAPSMVSNYLLHPQKSIKSSKIGGTFLEILTWKIFDKHSH